MYLQPAFREDRLDVLHQTMRETRLATLVSSGTGGLDASHVPVILDTERGPKGTLFGHLSRANPQWQQTDTAAPALAIFQGADAYISPSWYAAKREHGQVVPTWNYVAIHAHGPISYFDDTERLHHIVTTLTNHHEANRAEPWAVTDAPEDFTAVMLKSIVGFQLTIERLEGKWKMNQNRSDADRQGVVDGLKRDGEQLEAAVADIMDRGLQKGL